jgi:abortive infection bacteriophage resistance protein
MPGGEAMRYSKPFKTYEEQADLLISRGMSSDRTDLITHLRDVGYYRLSGYWHIFKRPDDSFWPGTTFERVWDFYTFDRQLKLVVFDAIERVEVYLRTQLAYELAQAGEPFGYGDRSNLPNLSQAEYDKFLRRCREAFDRSREPFALHFKEVYGDVHKLPPYWMLANLMDFGMVLTLYRGAPNPVRKSISRAFGIEPKVMDSWLVTLNTTRNICAHHGRLWNRTLGTKPTIPRRKNDPRWHDPYEVGHDKVFVVLTMLSAMLEVVAPDTEWRNRLGKLLNTRSQADLRRMGFTFGWEKCPFWSKWCDAISTTIGRTV